MRGQGLAAAESLRMHSLDGPLRVQVPTRFNIGGLNNCLDYSNPLLYLVIVWWAPKPYSNYEGPYIRVLRDSKTYCLGYSS